MANGVGVRWLALLLGLVATGAGPSRAVRQLSQVKTIYVEPLAGVNGATLLRESLIKRLEKSGRFQVVGDAAQADAVMKGTGTLWLRGYSAINVRDPASNRVPVYGGYLSAELVGRGGDPLWSYLVTPSNLGWKTVVDDMTSTLVKKLVTARDEPGDAGATTPGAARVAVTELRGAGATFPQPLYETWFDRLRESHKIAISYSAVGSEEGMRLLADKKVDFAASDVDPSEDYQLSDKGGEFLRVASVLGAVVAVYNLPDLRDDVHFTAQVLAEIYLGEITRWNDAKIAKYNKGLALPNAPIVVVHRAEGSGTTFAWSSFLAGASPEWKLNVGTGLRLTWPTGIGVDGNQGVASTVQRTKNSIGYVELVYAIRGQLAYGAVQNSAGEFVRPDLDSLTAAASSATAGKDLVSMAVPLESHDKYAYPIAMFTWLLAPRQMEDGAKKTAMVELLQWALTSGQKACSALGYAPLPHEFAERELEVVEKWSGRQ
jgi:phosphate transport system substrate-binding protein